ncbi:hypothetical protein IWQ56_003872, partial [Coemansia nantahalensis]
HQQRQADWVPPHRRCRGRIQYPDPAHRRANCGAGRGYGRCDHAVPVQPHARVEHRYRYHAECAAERHHTQARPACRPAPRVRRRVYGVAQRPERHLQGRPPHRRPGAARQLLCRRLAKGLYRQRRHCRSLAPLHLLPQARPAARQHEANCWRV